MSSPDSVEKALLTFDHLGGDEVLDGAITDCVRALNTPAIRTDPIQHSQWKILEAGSFCLRFERDGRNEDLTRAKESFQALTNSHLSLLQIRALYGLGRIYEAEYDHYGTADSLQESCNLYREAMNKAARTSHCPAILSDEIAVHLSRHLGNLTLEAHGCDEVYPLDPVSLLSDTIRRIDDACPLKAYALAYLSATYLQIWEKRGRESKESLIKCEELLREALRICPLHRHRPRFLKMLANTCKEWDTPERTQEAVDLALESMALLKTNPPVRFIDTTIVHSLAVAYFNLYEMGGRLSDLDEAVKYSRILAVGPEIGLAYNLELNNLCCFLSARFEACGLLIDIDDAIEIGRQALDHGPNGQKHRIHYNLGRAHLLRYSVSDDHGDFQAAEVYLVRGLENQTTPALLPFFYTSLAKLHILHFDISAQLRDLDLAVETGRQAVSLIENMVSSEGPSVYSEHGANLLRRFELQMHPQDLTDSVVNQETALRLAPTDFHERHLILFRYGRSLRLRYEFFNDPLDWEACAEALRDAIDRATTARLSKQSAYLAEMGALFSTLYARHLMLVDLNTSQSYYMKASQVPEGLVIDRFKAAIAGARLAQEHGLVAQATEFFSAAVSFLPRIAWLGLNTTKRHARLVQTASQLACDGAASAIRADQLERAVELLDEGRSVIWRSLLDLRADMRSLEEIAPELAHQLLIVGQELEHDDIGNIPSSVYYVEQQAARRRRTAERWDELVGAVRCLEGFGSFLRPVSFSVLKQAGNEGPAVLLNISRYGSDALIVFDGDIRVVPLPGLDVSTVRQLAYALTQALHVPADKLGRKLLEGVLSDTARQLWYGGISGVAAALSQALSHRSDPLLHVWWIPTGLLSLLPIHCAGPDAGGPKGIPDLFISSYTTTLSALLHSRTTQMSQSLLNGSPSRMLVIGVAETPGMPTLPSTNQETHIVAQRITLHHSCTLLWGPDATVNAVTRLVPECNWIHVCTHGHWEPELPLDSAFNLADGSLSISRIVQMRLKKADFAFLSACHTARHTAWVPDESLHMSAAMQIAGFKGVLGTAWAMADQDGPRLAERFYHWLLIDGRPLEARKAAEALHFAIDDMRRTGVPLYRWGAFVHFGI